MAIVPKSNRPQSKGKPVNPSAGSLELASEYRPSVTVIRSLDHPLTKRFYLDDQGEVQRQNYQNASHFEAEDVPISGIRGLSQLLTTIAGHQHGAVVRGVCTVEKHRPTLRRKEFFPEHPDGTRWVMLDIDGEEVPDDMSVVSVEAVRWLIQEKLPSEFRNVTFHCQFSGSAGVLDAKGALLKPGLRVHLFFFLDRCVRGDLLSAYLCRHCIDTGFYTIEANKGHVAQFKHGIDPAPIRSSIQLHYVANPIIENGVKCLLTDTARNGLIEGEKDVVTIPAITESLIYETRHLQSRLRGEWQKANGYTRKKIQLSNSKGVVSVPYYQAPTVLGEIRRGRTLNHTTLQDEKFCRLFFDDEGTPGSYYVVMDQPQLARRYGDGEIIPLKELSEDAYVHIRDELKWFTEVPYRDMTLNEQGFVLPFNTFAHAKYSLILAPTGAGKTTAVIDWMREKAEKCVVVYVAQTIPLVNQMFDDLAAAAAVASDGSSVAKAAIECFHYRDFKYDHTPQAGIFVTTNKSLPRVLECLSFNSLTPYCLIIDEVHMALDDFSQSQKQLDFFCSAISRARSVIFMTGTFTDIQRSMLSGTIARLEGGHLAEQKYCCYEFSQVKQNPLKICKLEYFRADVIELFESICDKHKAGETLPRVMVMLSSSKMEMFRMLEKQYGMEDLVEIVSRPECLQEDIEAARVGDKPILVTSPLFSVGLNLVRQLEVLYCRFDHLDADASRVIQTINRANRGDVACEVRIYANPIDEPFFYPLKTQVIDQMREALEAESDIVNSAIDMPVLLDRMAYREYREIESEPNRAIGQLIRENGFQNYRVIECLEEVARDKKKTQAFRALKKAADCDYDQNVMERFPHFRADVADQHFWRLQCLADERRNAWKASELRTDREIEDDELAVLMQLCDLDDSPAKARKIDKKRLQVLFGDREPWLSDIVNANQNSNWAEAAAQKTEALNAVVEVLRLMATGRLDGYGFAKKLNRDKSLQEGVRALAMSERDYLSLDRSFRQLAVLRKNVRDSNTVANREKAEEFALDLVKPFLESIGVFFSVEGTGRGRKTNFQAPLVPVSWDFNQMVAKLKHRKALLQALPVEYSVISRLLDPGPRVSPFGTVISLCRGCKLFDAACCALGNRVDWSTEGYESPALYSLDDCPDYHPARQERVAAA